MDRLKASYDTLTVLERDKDSKAKLEKETTKLCRVLKVGYRCYVDFQNVNFQNVDFQNVNEKLRMQTFLIPSFLLFYCPRLMAQCRF
jgi:hypothetical protein